jgi:hypothetical protein
VTPAQQLLQALPLQPHVTSSTGLWPGLSLSWLSSSDMPLLAGDLQPSSNSSSSRRGRAGE